MITVYYIVLVLSVLAFATVLTLAAYVWFKRVDMMAAVNERSNHRAPVPTGVGIGFMVTIAAFLVVVNAPGSLVIGTLLLAVVSLMDDRASLPPLKRLGFQAIAVILVIHEIDAPVFQGLLPFWLDQIVAGFLWLWVINLTNFMDGIDEITVTEVASICLGIVLIRQFSADIPYSLMIDSVVIATGVLAFYPWNAHPARCFMGDAGSIPLGFLLGYLLLDLASQGAVAIALILPAYYVCDATVTLLYRAAKRKPLLQGHSTHFYQRAVRAGYSHRTVSRLILVQNVVGWLLALAATQWLTYQWVMVAAAYVVALSLCVYFTQKPAQVLHEVTA